MANIVSPFNRIEGFCINGTKIKQLQKDIILHKLAYMVSCSMFMFMCNCLDFATVAGQAVNTLFAVVFQTAGIYFLECFFHFNFFQKVVKPIIFRFSHSFLKCIITLSLFVSEKITALFHKNFLSLPPLFSFLCFSEYLIHSLQTCSDLLWGFLKMCRAIRVNPYSFFFFNLLLIVFLHRSIPFPDWSLEAVNFSLSKVFKVSTVNFHASPCCVVPVF